MLVAPTPSGVQVTFEQADFDALADTIRNLFFLTADRHANFAGFQIFFMSGQAWSVVGDVYFALSRRFWLLPSPQ